MENERVVVVQQGRGPGWLVGIAAMIVAVAACVAVFAYVTSDDEPQPPAANDSACVATENERWARIVADHEQDVATYERDLAEAKAAYEEGPPQDLDSDDDGTLDRSRGYGADLGLSPALSPPSEGEHKRLLAECADG